MKNLLLIIVLLPLFSYSQVLKGDCASASHDALVNYDIWKPLRTGLIPAMIFPPAGLIVTLITSKSPPKDLNIPTSKEERSYTYYSCYEEKALRMKKRNLWKGFGIGVGINVTAVLLFLAPN